VTLDAERVAWLHQDMSAATAILADSHAIFRRGLRQLLEEAQIHVAGEAENLPGLLSQLHGEGAPHFVFVDAALADRAGLGVIRHSVADQTRLVFLVDVAIPAATLLSLMELGPAGCLERNQTPNGFARSIEAIRRGEVALSRTLTQRLCTGIQSLADRQHAAEQAQKLTPRERKILRYVSQAARNRDIAEALSISEHTVKRHVQNILQKLELPTRVAAATFFECTPFAGENGHD
jgi:DNA-binding NarL/FixJ family response regulator